VTSARRTEAAAPPLSVVLPVRDAMPYLRESVASILGQTHRDFEFVIVDDGSTDGSSDFLREQAALDPRIRLHRLESSVGVVGASNRVVSLSSAPLVARMDADDVCEPDRLERQLDVFAGTPDAVVVGAMADGIDAAGRRVRGPDRWRLLRRSMFPPFPHASMMLRREAFDAVGGYREDCESWHDVELTLRLARVGRVLVLPETLYHYRYRADSVTHSRPAEQVVDEARIMWRCMEELRRGGDYEHVLRSGGTAGPPAPVDPATWYGHYIDAMLLWSGLPPATSRGNGGSPPERLRRAWQRRHPASLRAFLRVLVAARDRLAGLALWDGRVRQWRYG
jgi:glycosyltransferase involved in cell wall biosynthesis